MHIRIEQDDDRAAIEKVNGSAFETAAEADLVNVLRDRAAPVVSLVAEDRDQIVGHIMFSPVALSGHPALKLMGLAPMAVTSEHQRKGVGSVLVRAGLDECRKLGVGAVVVLGHAQYYPRFGFKPAARFGIGCEYEVPAGAFMVIELERGFLRKASGTVKYNAAFDRF